MKSNYRLSFWSRFRAALAVFKSKNCVVLTFDKDKPVNQLGELYLVSAIYGLPQRVANAALVLAEYDQLDTQEGAQDALNKARKILARS